MHYFSEVEGNMPYKKGSRKWHIINTLVDMLESHPQLPVTTARLALQVGVSEAALYKHFPSKDRIFSTLIDLTELLIAVRTKPISQRMAPALVRCMEMANIWLLLAEEYPGIACILSGSCLQGGSEHLLIQHMRMCERFELQLRRLFKEAASKEGVRLVGSQAASASIVMDCLMGRTWRFVCSHFSLKPTQYWQEFWKALVRGMVI